MKHDWKAFGEEIATLLKTRGNRGCRGCSPDKPLSDNEFMVTPRGASRLPLEIEGLPDHATRGNHKATHLQSVRSAAAPVTPQNQQGRTLDDDRPAPAEWHAILAELKERESPDWMSPDV